MLICVKNTELYGIESFNLGIKLDKGYDKSGLPNTLSGPLGHPETWCKGIDDLEKRAQEAYAPVSFSTVSLQPLFKPPT